MALYIVEERLTSSLQPPVSKLFPINRVELTQRDLHISQVFHTFVLGSFVAGDQGCLMLLGEVCEQQADSLRGEGKERMRGEAEDTV